MRPQRSGGSRTYVFSPAIFDALEKTPPVKGAKFS